MLLFNNMCKALKSQSCYSCVYMSFLPCGQLDDDHVWSKYVADLWAGFIPYPTFQN